MQNGLVVPDESLFCIDDGVYFEFYANLSTAPESVA